MQTRSRIGMIDRCDHCEREVPAGTGVCPFCKHLVLTPAQRCAQLKRIALAVFLIVAVVASTALYRSLSGT